MPQKKFGGIFSERPIDVELPAHKPNRAADTKTYMKLSAYVPRTLHGWTRMAMAKAGTQDQGEFLESLLVQSLRSIAPEFEDASGYGKEKIRRDKAL